jgi:thiol-disulfide isomerase/thioredoxin
MRRWLAVLLLAPLAAPAVPAQEKPGAKPSPAFQALKDEFERAQAKFEEAQKKVVEEAQKAFEAAKTDAEKKAIQKKLMAVLENGPARQYSPRFLAFAQKNPQDPAAFDAVLMALQTSGGPKFKEEWDNIFNRLRADYVTKPEIKQAVRMVGNLNDAATDQLLRDVIARNPDRKIQALACKTLAGARKSAAQLAQGLKDDAGLKTRIEDQVGTAYVQHLLANADKARDEEKALSKLLGEKYGDIYPDLSVGKKAPEVVSQGLDGKEARLSALKGKVVVLDIWATWCPPCKAMIPHEREMVERLKNKPFVLVSVSADAKKETLTEFLAKEKMPWTHWWNGSEGGILEAWDVQAFPTIYVLDAQGVIRFRDLRGELLERAVNELLKEMETKKTS